MTREIALRGGKIALVDEEDYECLIRFRWRESKTSAQTTIYAISGTSGRHSMHRLIMNAPPDVGVDHINGNGLDNRKANLRFATNSQNQQNRTRLSLNTSGYRGVTLHRQVGKWQAQIKKDNKNYYLGLFDSPEAAGKAYDEAAKEMFGEFARLNFPLEAA